jgi:hypothetical protein
VTPSLALQLALWSLAGASLPALALADWRRARTPESFLLLLWIAGTLVFAGLVNWTVSGRNLLPALPAASILIVRRLQARGTVTRLWRPVIASAILALLVARADLKLAESARRAAHAIMERAQPVGPVRFQGHWGFQYYMEQLGAAPLDAEGAPPTAGVVVLPRNNSYPFPVPGELLERWFVHEEPLGWIGVMSARLGAGYYSDGWGPLPFAFGRVPAERYRVDRVR